MAAVPIKPKNPILGPSEHISLESDVSETRAKPNLSKALASFELRNAARGSLTQIAILQDHYAAIRTQRRSAMHGHNVDLRFVDPQPQASRHVSWRWFYAALSFTVLTATAILMSVYLRYAIIAEYGVSVSVALGSAAVGCYLMCYYFTTETLRFVTSHGRAPALCVVGSLGMLRRARPCAVELVKHIKIARMHFQQSKAAHLRDEMREHARLSEQGALTEKQYSDAKMRILKAHD